MEIENSPLKTKSFILLSIMLGPKKGIAMLPKLFTWSGDMRGLKAGVAVTHARHQRETGLSVPLQGAGQ